MITLFLVRLRNLGYQSYEEYLVSDHWRSVRAAYLKSGRPQNCLVCGGRNFHLHHVTYDRLGRESLDDLIPLCPEHHRQLHAYHDKHRLSLEDYGEAVAVIRGRWERKSKKQATRKSKSCLSPATILARKEARAAKKQEIQSARYAEDRLSDALDRLEKAEAEAIAALTSITVLLSRAGISDPVNQSREVSRLYRAFKSRGMRVETVKFRAYLDARFELGSAKTQVTAFSIKVAEFGLRPPWVVV